MIYFDIINAITQPPRSPIPGFSAVPAAPGPGPRCHGNRHAKRHFRSRTSGFNPASRHVPPRDPEVTPQPTTPRAGKMVSTARPRDALPAARLAAPPGGAILRRPLAARPTGGCRHWPAAPHVTAEALSHWLRRGRHYRGRREGNGAGPGAPRAPPGPPRGWGRAPGAASGRSVAAGAGPHRTGSPPGAPLTAPPCPGCGGAARGGGGRRRGGGEAAGSPRSLPARGGRAQ